jgi:hypothetical protein
MPLVTLDVWRQRHPADAGEDRHRRLVGMHVHLVFPLWPGPDDIGLDIGSHFKVQWSGAVPVQTFEHDVPPPRPDFGQEQAFDPAAGGFAQHEARGQHARVVEYKHVAGAQPTGKVRERAVGHGSVGPAIVE